MYHKNLIFSSEFQQFEFVMTKEQSAPKRLTFPVFVGVLAGLVSVTVGAITIYTFFLPKPDERFAQMISTAEGMKSALERIAATVETSPDLLGDSAESARELAISANTVTQSVQAAAQRKGIQIASTDLWGDRMIATKEQPLLLQSPSGEMFGISPFIYDAFWINNENRGANRGSVLNIDVGNDSCKAFVHSISGDAVDLTLRCE